MAPIKQARVKIIALDPFMGMIRSGLDGWECCSVIGIAGDMGWLVRRAGLEPALPIWQQDFLTYYGFRRSRLP